MLKLFNTMTGKKEEFKPIEEGKVKMYVCGITVYDFCHIGHARAMISFDVITRFLRHIGYDLTFVRNITDVDDKIIKRAEENGEKPSELTERMIAAMHEDELALGNKLPDQEPKATEFMQQIIDMIQVLVDKGFAYQGESGDVFYRASKFSEYGKLNNRKLEDMLAGARIEVEASKEHPADFVLWKPAKALGAKVAQAGTSSVQQCRLTALVIILISTVAARILSFHTTKTKLRNLKRQQASSMLITGCTVERFA